MTTISLSRLTSSLAHREHVLMGRKGQNISIVRKALAAHPDSTALELCEYIWEADHFMRLAQDVVEVRRRLADLKNAGEAEITGTTNREPNPREVVTWRLL